MTHGNALDGTVLVTGGAGYIGSHTVRSLREAGRDVVVLDSLELGRREAVIDAPLVVGDIADRDLVASTCTEHGVTQAGTVELVEACLAADVQNIVFSSSCSVYGTPPSVPVTEDAPIDPESVYAETKAMVEKILKWYGVTSGLTSVSLRYFNAAGASFDGRIGEDWSYSINLIPVVMKALLLPDLRRRLRHARRHLHPRLHPCRGLGRCAPQGAPISRQRWRFSAGQRGDRHRVVGARCHQGGREGCRRTRAALDRRASCR